MDWWLKIERINNGYYLTYNANEEDNIVESSCIEEDDADELKASEELLWFIMEHFNLLGSRHDSERLRIIREPGDKHT